MSAVDELRVLVARLEQNEHAVSQPLLMWRKHANLIRLLVRRVEEERAAAAERREVA